MDWDEVLDIAEDLTIDLAGDERIRAFREQADSLAPGEIGRAEFLSELGEYLALESRYDEARQAHHDAIADGGPTTLDPRAGLLDVAFRTSNEPEAEQLLADLLALARTGKVNVMSHESVGETLEERGRLKEAHRWFTMPMRDLDPDDLESLSIGCLNGRYRVRRALELPLDRYDEAALELRAVYRARSELHG